MLMILHCLDKVGRLCKAFMRTCVQPCKSLSEKLNIKGVFLEIYSVEVGDFQLAPCGRLQVLCVCDNLIVIKI